MQDHILHSTGFSSPITNGFFNPKLQFGFKLIDGLKLQISHFTAFRLCLIFPTAKASWIWRCFKGSLPDQLFRIFAFI